MRMACAGWIVLAACAAAPTAAGPVDRALVRSPEGLQEFFSRSADAGRFGDCYRVLTPTARRLITEDEFLTTLRNDVIRSLISRLRLASCEIDEGGETGSHVLENPEFAFRRRVRIVREEGAIWTYDLTREDFEVLRDRVWAFYAERPGWYDGRRHVFPAGWRHHPPGGEEEP